MEKKWRKRMALWRSLVLAACAGLVFASMLLLPLHGAAQTKAGQPKTLRLGYLMCVSGWFSVFDAVEERYFKTAAKMINDRGGLTIKGEKYNLELVGEDGKSTMDGVAAAAVKLVFDDKVKFVVGPTAFYGPAATPVFEQNKILHVLAYSTCQPGEISANNPYAFLVFDATIGNTIAAIKAMKKEYPNVKKVAVATPDDGAIPYLMPKVKKVLESYGYTMVGDPVAFPNEMEDFSPIAAKINSIKDAQGVFIINGAPAGFGLIAKGLRSLGNYEPLSIPTVATCAEIMQIAGQEAATNIITTSYTPDVKGNPPLLDELYDKAGKKPPIFLNTTTGLWTLAKIIQAADSIDPAVVKAKWESMDKVETLFGTGIISGDETYGIRHHAVGHPAQYEKLVKGKVVYGGWIDVGAIP